MPNREPNTRSRWPATHARALQQLAGLALLAAGLACWHPAAAAVVVGAYLVAETWRRP